MASVLAAIQMIYQILTMAKGLVAFVEANKTEAWFQNLSKLTADIQSAKTEQDYKDAAKKLRDAWTSSG